MNTDSSSVAEQLQRFKPYPAYKDSGIDWLGEVPEHWEVKRLKFLAPVRISKLNIKPDEAVYVGLEHVESWTGRLLLENQPETVDSVVATFQAGDVLFGKLRPYLAKAARPDFDGACTSEILPLRPTTNSSQSFIMYWLLNVQHIRWLDSLTYGTKMPRVSSDQVGSGCTSVPPESEQVAIAAFLDRETAKIDALIAKKERLIELLQEKRTALITHAVTKGLDPNVPMKDSGVEWLGEIPEHWGKLTKLSRITSSKKHSFVNGPFGSDLLTSEIISEGVPVLYIRDISSGYYFRASEAHIRPEKAKQLDFCRVDPGDVLVAKVGDPPGTAVIYPKSEPSGIVTQDVIRIRINQSIVSAKYLTYFLNSYSGKGLIDQISVESTRMRISLSDYKSSLFPLPPLEEQNAIAECLDIETNLLIKLVMKIEEAIEQLKDYRIALISAAVTGKIDVRE